MRLLLIITDFGSFNNFLSELAIDLVSSDVELHVICSEHKIIHIDDKFDYEGLNIKFHFLDIPRRVSLYGQIKTAREIRKVILKVKPNLIHSHFTTGTFPTILFKCSKFKYWATFHGLGLNASVGIKKLIFTVVERFCFARLDKIFLLNQLDFDLVHEIYPLKARKYLSLGVGCNIDKFDPSRRAIHDNLALKKRLNINDEFVITFTGRFVQFKGFHLVIRTMISLEKLYPGRFKFIVIGAADPIHKTGLFEEEEVLIRDFPALINVGYTSEVEAYLAISDLFLFPSKKEGLPTCVLESLSMGVPVLTMNARGNADVIVNNYNGYLIPNSSEKNEINDFMQLINNLYLDREKLKILSVNALKDRLKYARDIFVQEHLKLYNQYKYE